MPADTLPLGYILAPAILVVALLYLLAPLLSMRRPWHRGFVFAVVWLVVARYMAWRLFDTVLPATGTWVELAWVWFCFAIEVLAVGDALILFLSFLRSTDRRLEADRHEARLRALAPGKLPSVDVYIPTYNEPFDVLEKTIVSALSLDYPDHRVWVLDDGRRPWLQAYCAEKGAGYITRPDNAHAKAGNINHALKQTDADYVAIFDADFIPQRNFLMRTMGFFEDAKVGIVQVPHAFYNHDPMQTNLAVRKSLPDDQRFFFEAIMPSRDGWDAAFCCGSNSVTRRAALRQIGDGLPGGSITEDMLLSLALLRKGFVTRYLCERLAFGLAPESISAFFVQRQRWARGAMQILYLPEGPLGRGIGFMHRLLFLPTHWLTQSLMLIVAIVAPVVFLWTGLAPLVNVTVESCLHYLVPSVLALFGGLMAYAPRHYFPLAAQVLGTFQSFKLLPAVLQTLVRPHGLLFKVTPKGAEAGAGGYERGIFWTAAGLLLATAAGVVVNAVPDWRIVEQAALVPLVATWCGINIAVLLLVCMLCLQAPIRRGEERFTMDEPLWLRSHNGAMATGRIEDLSLSGLGLRLDTALPASAGDRLRLFIRDVGHVTGKVARRRDSFLGIHFELPPGVERDLMIRKIFTGGLNTTTVVASAWSVTIGLLRSIWAAHSAPMKPVPAPVPAAPMEKLPARTLVLPPIRSTVRLTDLVAARQDVAA